MSNENFVNTMVGVLKSTDFSSRRHTLASRDVPRDDALQRLCGNSDLGSIVTLSEMLADAPDMPPEVMYRLQDTLFTRIRAVDNASHPSPITDLHRQLHFTSGIKILRALGRERIAADLSALHDGNPIIRFLDSIVELIAMGLANPRNRKDFDLSHGSQLLSALGTAFGPFKGRFAPHGVFIQAVIDGLFDTFPSAQALSIRSPLALYFCRNRTTTYASALLRPPARAAAKADVFPGLLDLSERCSNDDMRSDLQMAIRSFTQEMINALPCEPSENALYTMLAEVSARADASCFASELRDALFDCLQNLAGNRFTKYLSNGK